MRHFISLLSAVSAIGIGSAVAADLPVRTPPAQMIYSPIPAAYWNGVYVGLNAGYGWANTSVSNVGGIAVTGSSDLNGFVGGGQIGYNWQGASPLVLGIEADFQGTTQRRTDSGSGLSLKQELPYFGTVRGRIGYAIDRAMIYGTGGFAYTNYKMTVSGAGLTASDDSAKTGWTLGGGVEWKFVPNWSTRIEYLYVDTGNSSFNLAGVPITGRAKENIVRIGLNYHLQ
jgi:outer membrane immunogenic protein